MKKVFLSLMALGFLSIPAGMAMAEMKCNCSQEKCSCEGCKEGKCACTKCGCQSKTKN